MMPVLAGRILMGRSALIAAIARAALAFAAVLSFAVFWLSGIAAAQPAYPTHTVRFIVSFGAASATDITARLFADRLSARWGYPVIVENRPGGDGLVAIKAFLDANDDHALLFAPVGTFTVHPYEHDSLPYQAGDLNPIVGVSMVELAVSTTPALGVDNLDQLVALARAQPGKINAAAANGISDFLLFGFIKKMGLQIAKVPYRDIVQAPNDLAENRIQLLSTSLAVVRALMQAGRVKVLAVTSKERAPGAPDVPTAAEAGYPALTFESGGGLFGPRTMPAALRQRIAADFRAVSTDPVITARMVDIGSVLAIRGPDEFTADIERQRQQLAEIAAILGLKATQ
jgi:tripartite-type tricarboxylate transporter receptor subunit TctC